MSEVIVIDASSGEIKVYREEEGRHELLSDTGVSASNGRWRAQKVGADHIKIEVLGAGNFDVSVIGGKWIVLPERSFLSPTDEYVVRLVEEKTGVRAFIGESEPPYTDVWKADEVLLSETDPDKCEVLWISDHLAEIRMPSKPSVRLNALKHAVK